MAGSGKEATHQPRSPEAEQADAVLYYAALFAAANHTRAWLSPAESYLSPDRSEVVLTHANAEEQRLPKVVRGAAALGLMRANKDVPLERVPDGLFAWMAWSRATGRPSDSLNWFGLSVTEERPSASSDGWCRGGARIPAQVQALRGAARWEAFVEHASDLYHRFENVFVVELEAEIESVIRRA